MKMRLFILTSVFGLILGAAQLHAADPAVIADAQIVTTGEKEYLLTVRSSKPQAFDVVPSNDPLLFKVRLHKAVLGSLTDFASVPEFGSVSITQEAADKVLIQVTAAEIGFKTKASQGNNPNTVEIRVVWAPDTTPPVLSAIKSSSITASGAVIQWTTDEVSDSQVMYGKIQPESQLSNLDALTLNHQITLTGLLPNTSYFFKVKSKDAAGNLASSSSSIFKTTVAAFQEANGTVSIEAENSDNKVTRNGKSWNLQTTPSGFSGSGHVAVLPNTEMTIDTGYVGTAAELVYRINFKKTGFYTIWIRGRANNANDDSLHVGLDGYAINISDRIDGFSTAWGWSRHTIDNTNAAINVGTPGIHTLNIWMREDGFQLDKIVMTTNTAAAAPAGNGPAESSKS